MKFVGYGPCPKGYQQNTNSTRKKICDGVLETTCGACGKASTLWPSKPTKWGLEKGATIATLGLMPCPWCGARTEEKEKTYIAICVKNPKHIIQWLPWGG